MAAQQDLPYVPSNVRFRVLIIGRANAGKTTILQRVCETTESPEIYSVDLSGARIRVWSSIREAVSVSLSLQVQQLETTMEVGQA
jgi:GTPase SAR1 family protein